ncbi:hypothetical protein [Idiomarina zobellii]|uniref:Uncharacterized protein n=1 Tax=Idiomarina zobellii TaxID=86103 RepID=A0A837N9J1_9GAMM|nr:hypothetical protein [Idiomarina zobellii]KPD23574.1 hypothetical protein AFK76_08745 [Idiomarina zobellii]SDF94244.1 hypothetical protein SAMN04515658_1082 [Idiomarina zobellii]
MQVSGKQEFRLKIGDRVSLSDFSRWKVTGFAYKNGLSVRLKRKGSERYMAIHKVRDANGVALEPGNKYLLILGDETSRFVLRLNVVGNCKASVISIYGEDKSRKVGGKWASKINYTKFCGTKRAFDLEPEAVVIKVGNEVKMRADFGSTHYYGAIEMSNKVGIVESIEKPERALDWTTTLTVSFTGIRKQYRVHRFIDSSGNMMQLGWHYRIQRDQNTFFAIPTRRIDPDRVEWSDPDPDPDP